MNKPCQILGIIGILTVLETNPGCYATQDYSTDEEDDISVYCPYDDADYIDYSYYYPAGWINYAEPAAYWSYYYCAPYMPDINEILWWNSVAELNYWYGDYMWFCS
ncbi:MAG: hypothetical protein LBJ92_04685 [Holosporales bacterium]|jgi:hypothetical protein|nr:hypothetical protein [Holosporales bacterium]